MGLGIPRRPHLSRLCGHIHLTPLLVLYNRGSVSVCRAINILVGQSIWHYKQFNDHGSFQDGAQGQTGCNELLIELEFHHPHELLELLYGTWDVVNVHRMLW